MISLTPQQRAVFTGIERHNREHGSHPALRDLSDMMCAPDNALARRMVVQLFERGALTINRNTVSTAPDGAPLYFVPISELGWVADV